MDGVVGVELRDSRYADEIAATRLVPTEWRVLILAFKIGIR